MSRLLLGRAVLLVIGVITWGYGYRVDDANIRLAAIGILVVAMLLRFVPKRWQGDDPPP
jgi:hypothetical protein